MYKEEILNEAYWPIFYELKYLVFSQGVGICADAEKILQEKENKAKDKAI